MSLAACHLLQVMFDALFFKEGVKKGFRGKEGAIIVGESLEASLCPLGVDVPCGEQPSWLLLHLFRRKAC